MAVTELERKVRKNRMRAIQRQEKIKNLLKKPVIKNVNIEELKAAFKK
eukprot:gene725-898_t